MKQTILTSKQNELLENLIVKYNQIVTFDQILNEAKIFWDYKQTKNLITKLVKNGWLIRIKKGLYAISDLSSRGFLSLSPYNTANLLVPDSYVSFESALQRYGMFDQLTNKTISVSLKAYKSVVLNNIEYSYIKTKPEFYFGSRDMTIDSHVVHIATAEKALIDIINFRRNQYYIDLVIEILINNRQSFNFELFSTYLEKLSLTTIKIFGLIFDILAIKSDKLYKIIKANHSVHWMTRGDTKFNSKWRLYYNSYFDKYQSR